MPTLHDRLHLVATLMVCHIPLLISVNRALVYLCVLVYRKVCISLFAENKRIVIIKNMSIRYYNIYMRMYICNAPYSRDTCRSVKPNIN